MKIKGKWKKLKIIFVNYGLGKYYTYTDEDGYKHPIIEVNSKMLDYDVDLFVWVFNHELEHYLYYQNPKNEGKKNNLAKEFIRLMLNPEKTMLLNHFERTHKPDCFKKEFYAVKHKLK